MNVARGENNIRKLEKHAVRGVLRKR